MSSSAQLIEFDGIAKTQAEWSQEIGISRTAFRDRYSAYLAKQISKEDLFAPKSANSGKRRHPSSTFKDLDKHQLDTIYSLKSGITIKFLKAFSTIVLPGLEEEMMHYIQTNKKGGRLSLFSEFAQHIFTKDAIESPDQVQANVIVIQPPPPQKALFDQT